jgi:apolipoprotein N-acyltransferase
VTVLNHVKYGGNLIEGSMLGSGTLQTVETPYGKLSAVICWDADFPAVMAQAGAQQVDLMFVPANDWHEIKDIHAGMVRFRAIENGMSIFRQTGNGVSVVVDAYGRQAERLDSFSETTTGFTNSQLTQTASGSVATFYPIIGDSVGRASLVGLLGLLIGAWLVRKRPTLINR